MSNQPDQPLPVDISALSFDSFARDGQRDVVCLAPIRTIIRREEEIVLVRRVRKVEEIDAPLSCPATSDTLSSSSSYQTITAPPQPIYQPTEPAAPTGFSTESVSSVVEDVIEESIAPAASTVVEESAPIAVEQPIASNYTASPTAPAALVDEELIVHSYRNCYRIEPAELTRLQEEIAVSKLLQPGSYTITLRSGTFDYQASSGHSGEALVLLWLYGGRVINQKTGVTVNSTWASLNGYGDTLTINVLEPTHLCSFFFDTYLDDNEGEVRLTIEGTGYFSDLVVHSQRNCYYIDSDSMKRLEETAASKTLPIGSYAIQIKSGAFGYRTDSGTEGEPLVLLWIYGGSVRNHATGVEVGATWVSLNGYEDTLLLDVLEPATLAAFFYDTYLDDNEGEVRLSLVQV